MHRALLVALLVALPAAAAADPTNRSLIPFGERAAMLGNAGITSPYGEAVFYNPANLQRVGHPNLSVSGSTYLIYQLAVDPIFVLEGEDQPFEASGFVAIPSTVISTYRVGKLALANAILVPEALTFKNRVSFATPSSKVTILQELQQSELWLGGGAALELADGLSIGLSLFVARTTETRINFTRVETMGVFEQTTSSDVDVLGATAIAGIHYQRGRLGLGARLHSPSLRLRGTGDVYQSQLSTMTPGGGAVEAELEDVRVDRPVPLDAGLGLSLQATSNLLLTADLNLQLPATLTTLDDPRLERTTLTLRAAPRASLGLEWQLAPRKWLRAGTVLNRSASPHPRTSADATHEDYLGATLGFAWQSGRTQTALGAFYLHGLIETYVDGVDPPRRADATARLFGGLFTVSYRL